jgi:hypothetical protein
VLHLQEEHCKLSEKKEISPMKKAMYATIALFVLIMIAVIIVAEQHPVRLVKYQNGAVVESKK